MKMHGNKIAQRSDCKNNQQYFFSGLHGCIFLNGQNTTNADYLVVAVRAVFINRAAVFRVFDVVNVLSFGFLGQVLDVIQNIN